MKSTHRVEGYLRCRFETNRNIASTMPATIDSQGNPGIGVNVGGLDGEAVLTMLSVATWLLVSVVVMEVNVLVRLVIDVTVVELFDCTGSRFNSIVPGPVNVTSVGLVEAWQVIPPVQVQLEKPYPEGRLHPVTVAEPKSVLKNEPPLSTPGVEHEPQLTDADVAGLVRTLT